MPLQLIYRFFSALLSLLASHVRRYFEKDVELIVLRHQVRVLKKKNPRPKLI